MCSQTEALFLSTLVLRPLPGIFFEQTSTNRVPVLITMPREWRTGSREFRLKEPPRSVITQHTFVQIPVLKLQSLYPTSPGF